MTQTTQWQHPVWYLPIGLDGETDRNEPEHVGHQPRVHISTDESAMIFRNIQDKPSIPMPKNACGKCHEEVDVNQPSVLCEPGCLSWFHRKCTNLNVDAYYLTGRMCEKCRMNRSLGLCFKTAL